LFFDLVLFLWEVVLRLIIFYTLGEHWNLFMLLLDII
jgi:isoprenylcysteine carboxyl methyltransferase (ICMT) family protein YpbQ